MTEIAPGTVHDRGPIVVVTAMRLSRTARAELAARMGPGHVVRDIREAGNVADVVLIPPASHQLVGAIRSMFPGAKVLVSELVDTERGIDFGGPLHRAKDSGVDGYVLASDLDQVAELTRDVAAGRPVGALTSGNDLTRPAVGRNADDADLPTAADRGGRLHLTAAGPEAATALAAELRAVRLDADDWVMRLFGPHPDLTDLEVVAELVWTVAEQVLDTGGTVVLDDHPAWVDRARRAGRAVTRHPRLSRTSARGA